MNKINRFELVKRNCPKLNEVDLFSPFSVGNGEFAFSCDVTGLQTFTNDYKENMPLCTMSNWGWHSFTPPKELDVRTIKPQMHDTFGRQVGYYSSGEGQEEVFTFLRENPHRFHLGNIGFDITLENGEKAKINDITDIEQELDLYSGIIISKFVVQNVPVYVKTCCDPLYDAIAVNVKSELLKSGKLKINVKFPYGSQKMDAANWEADEMHNTAIIEQTKSSIHFSRRLDNDYYFSYLEFDNNVNIEKNSEHNYLISIDENEVEFIAEFSKDKKRELVAKSQIAFKNSIDKWSGFWDNGGAIDFSGSTDSRAIELEKRVILSQYLTAIQCSGSIPPQETGLTCNSWFGKAHLEMHWWHAAHFPLWGRTQMLENSMWWYKFVMAKAEETAKRQGYKGVRWQKMVDAYGVDTPSGVATLLIWQQPHPIFYAELIYRAKSDIEVLEKYKDIVFKTAEFMADFAKYDEETNRYILGAPLIPAQENHNCFDTLNPTYEIEYWYETLKIAQEWKERLGENRVSLWDDIIDNISKLPIGDNVYLAHEKCPKTFTEFNIDHPSMLNALGVLKGDLVDKEIMRNTLKKVLSDWEMPRTWGWDYPVMAMCAAKLNEPNLAIDCLFMDTPKNRYHVNGHNYQRPSLPLYLPGNGGLLAAVAMMAAGWDGNDESLPGFPKDGSWNVKFEGIQKYI